MTFTVSLLVTADAKGAKAELAATAAEAKKLGTATGAAGREARGAAGGVANLGSTSGATAARITTLANAEAAAGATALKMGQSHQLAAGSVGNLTAQFNDIGMMLAAGQNPLQLALQQGTQISQVIGPMGATGAVRALSAGFMGMISPISLITIGSIAAGAAMFQWLTGAGEDVVTLEDRVESLKDSISALDGATSAAGASFSDLFDSYGNYAVTAQKVLEIQAEIARLDSLRALSTAVGEISTTFGRFDLVVSDAGDTLRDDYMDTVNRLADQFDITRFQASALADALNAVGQAKGPDAQVKALAAAREQIELASGGLSGMSEEGRVVYDALLQAELAAARLAGVDVATGIANAADKAWSLANALELAARNKKAVVLDPRDSRYDPVAAEMERIKGEYGRVSPFDPKLNNPTRGRSAGRGTSEIDKQREALADLIADQERELALLRESDPVQKELLRHREALAGATEAERLKIEDLIATRIRESDAMERLEWVSNQTGDALVDALMGGADAGERLIETLKRAVLQAALLGNGPLSGLFGGGLFGGLFGGGSGGAGGLTDLFSGGDLFANIGGHAEGGMIHGKGSGTSDEIMARLSNGEFVMNARSTARYRHLLEAMNSGSPIPGFAAGGIIGGGAAGGQASGAGGLGAPIINIDMRGVQGSAEIEQRARDAVTAALANYDQMVLPTRVKAISPSSEDLR